MYSNSNSQNYIHGYSRIEQSRLTDQAQTLSDILHEGTRYCENESILEVGCGVGAQTLHLAQNSPAARFTCIDISTDSLNEAQQKIKVAGMKNVTFLKTDLFDPIFPPHSFDHIFVCFVLEHLSSPETALDHLKNLLKPGGSITVIEGDHGSTFFSPQSTYASKTIQCLIELQARYRGDSLIGRKLYPLLHSAGFTEPSVTPKMIYVDANTPSMIEGFTKNTFISMVAGIKPQVLASQMMSEQDFDRGLDDLLKTTAQDGTFCYTFFKATAIK
ncbi:MAG: methyltransferase domain-containing protein [Deltaproteobacteria bacterium]|nr:methyltransferase domain-containing protein [Deltaproteobacteria bacterium]MBN2673182.1 methyltransferase domain-containing protein [Deltaproteobacteria bacterium]